MDIKVSIITPSFNRAYIVEETAQSIFNQEYTNWEWVVVDDGSTDNSLEVLQGYAQKDDRVKVFSRDRQPKGACSCRNIAVEKSTGDYLLFLDTDDVLAPFCLKQRVEACLKSPEDDFVIFQMMQFKKAPYDMDLLWNIDKEQSDLSRVIIGDPVCQGTGTLWKKKSFEKVGMWDDELKIWQDIELHIRSFLYPVKYSKRLDLDPDVFIRISDDSLSRQQYDTPPKLRSRIKVFTDACNNIEQKGLLPQLRSSLRVMGISVITSAIRSRFSNEIAALFDLVRRLEIFTDKEIGIFKKYRLANNARLYKMPSLYKPIEKRTLEVVTPPDITLNKIKWTKASDKK